MWHCLPGLALNSIMDVDEYEISMLYLYDVNIYCLCDGFSSVPAATDYNHNMYLVYILHKRYIVPDCTL